MARELARDGAKLADAGDCDAALELFARAYALVPAPTIATMQARCLVELDRLLEALEVFERIQQRKYGPDAPAAFQRAVAEAEASARDLRTRIPRLKITVNGPGADSASLRVSLDDEPVVRALLGIERPIDPGAHRIEAIVPGAARAAQRVSLQEGRSYVVELQLQPASASAPPAKNVERAPSNVQRTLGWVALGTGTAALGTGIVTALMAGDRQSDLDGICDDGQCPERARDDLAEFRTLRTLSFVGYGVGFAGLATGAVLLLTAPAGGEPARDAAVRPWIGLGSAGLGGRF